MEGHNTNLKYIFLIESVLGISIVTFKTINQSTEQRSVKVIKPIFFILLVFIFSIYRFYHTYVHKFHISNISSLIIYRILKSIFLISTLFMGAYNCNKKITAALNLDAIEEHIKELNIELPGERIETAVVCGSVILYLLHIIQFVFMLISALVYNEGPTFLDVFIVFYYCAVKCSLMFGCTILLTKCFRIQQAVNKELKNLNTHFDEEELPTVQRRVAWEETTDIRLRTLTFIRTIHSVLTNTEEKVQSCFCLYVVWLALISACSAPSVTLLFLFSKRVDFLVAVPTMITHIVILTVIIFSHHQYQCCKEVTEEELIKLWQTTNEEMCCKDIRHLLCALNNCSEAFDCYFFNVDYSALAVILDSSLMVICTILSSSY